MSINRCPTCFSILIDTYANLESMAQLLMSLKLISPTTVVSPSNENLKTTVIAGIRKIESTVWEDDPVLTANGLSGPAYIGFNHIKAKHFKNIQATLTDLESQYIHPSALTVFTDIDAVNEFFIPKIKHIVELRTSIEKLLDVMGLSKETYFTKDENDYLRTSQTKTEWSEPNLSSPNTHVKACHLEELRHSPTRWWVDRFNFDESLHETWYWKKDEKRVVGYDGDSSDEVILDINTEDMKSQEINISGSITGNSVNTGGGNKYDSLAKVFRDKKSISDTYKSPEGQTEIIEELGVSAGKTGWAESSATISMTWNPWKFRILTEDNRPRIKMREGTNLFIDMPIRRSKYVSGGVGEGKTKTYFAIHLAVAFYDALGKVCPITYVLKTNEPTAMRVGSGGYVYGNLDNFLFDKRYIILDSNLVLNHVRHFYGNNDYYFCHSLKLSVTSYVYTKGTPDIYDGDGNIITVGHGNTSSLRISATLKQIGLTTKQGFFRNIVGGNSGGWGEGKTEVGPAPNDGLPWSGDNGGNSSYGGFSPPITNDKGVPFRIRGFGQVGGSPTINPGVQPPSNQIGQKQSNFRGNTQIKKTGRIWEDEKLYDDWYLDNTGNWVQSVGDGIYIPSGFTDLTESEYAIFREKYGTSGNNAFGDWENPNTPLISFPADPASYNKADVWFEDSVANPYPGDYPPNWDVKYWIPPWGWEHSLDFSGWSGAYISAHTTPRSLIFEGTLEDFKTFTELEGYSLDAIVAKYGERPEDLTGVNVKREQALEITYPDGTKDYHYFYDEDFDIGGSVPAGQSIFKNYVPYTLGMVDNHTSGMTLGFMDPDNPSYDTGADYGLDSNGQIWDNYSPPPE